MKLGAPASFGAQLKSLREAAGFTQEELATIAGLSVHAVSALERGERRRPHLDTVRALSAALDLTGPARDAFVRSARSTADTEVIESAGSQLPRPITGLVGREGDLVRLHELFSDPATRLVTLVGPGGVGKTRLALEGAHLLGSHGRARAIFVPLASVRDPARVAPAIAEALGLPDVTAVDLPRRVRAVCVEPTVLVLDNFEQIRMPRR